MLASRAVGLLSIAAIASGTKGDVLEELSYRSFPSATDVLSELCSKPSRVDLEEDGHYRPAFPASPVLGTCQEDDFIQLADLGEGYFSSVKKAIHVPSRTVVTLKYMNERMDLWDTRREECMHHRARLPTIRKHLCTFFSHGRRTPVLVLEFVEGKTLTDWLHDNRPVPEHLIHKWTIQLSLTIMALHQNSVTFGDLKPDNILITAEGNNVKLIDFGLAADPNVFEPGRSDRLCGTILYLSPEGVQQARSASGGRESFVHPSADLFALGLVLYRMTTSLPFYANENIRTLADREELYKEIMRGFRIPPFAHRSHPGLMDFVAKITQCDPKDRLGSDQTSYAEILAHPWMLSEKPLIEYVLFS